MHYVVAEEIWSLPKGNREAQLIRAVGAIVGGDRESATESAKKLASKFDHHNFEHNAPHPYWWGRNDNESESHRFVIRPAN
jgi:hypothetical protein